MKQVKAIVILAFSLLLISAAGAREIAEDPVQLLKSTAERFDKIRTYKCKATSIYKVYSGKKETTYRDVVLYSFQKPKNIRMKWLAPWNIKGQVAVYADDQLKVHLNWLPLSFPLDPDGNIAKDASGNRIYQTDLGTLIKQITDIFTTNPETVAKYEGIVDSRKGKLLKISLQNNDGIVYVYVDKELFLPVTVEYYSPEKKLVQAAYFEDMRVNVSMSPYEFIIE